MEPRAVVRDTNHITREPDSQASPTVQDRTAVRIKETETCTNCVNCQKEIINCHHTLSLSVILPSIKREIVTSLHAGRIKEFIENWALITQDPWVLQTVQGFQLPLVGQPTQATAPPQLQLSLAQQDLVSTEVQAMIEKRAISGVQPDQRGFVSQIFLVPKIDGGHRPVVNLEGSKQVHCRGALQDGGTSHGERSCETRGLVGEIGSKRCLLSGTSRP